MTTGKLPTGELDILVQASLKAVREQRGTSGGTVFLSEALRESVAFQTLDSEEWFNV